MKKKNISTQMLTEVEISLQEVREGKLHYYDSVEDMFHKIGIWANMQQMEGYWNIIPKIKKVSFPVRGKMSVHLEDGRVVIVSLSAFPSIKKVAR